MLFQERPQEHRVLGRGALLLQLVEGLEQVANPPGAVGIDTVAGLPGGVLRQHGGASLRKSPGLDLLLGLRPRKEVLDRAAHAVLLLGAARRGAQVIERLVEELLRLLPQLAVPGIVGLGAVVLLLERGRPPRLLDETKGEVSRHAGAPRPGLSLAGRLAPRRAGRGLEQDVLESVLVILDAQRGDRAKQAGNALLEQRE